jgi:hypothetical protein
MIDTGAAVTVIDPQLRQRLGLPPFRVRPLLVPSHSTAVQAWCYKLDLLILHSSGTAANSLVVPMLTVFEMPISHTGVEF